MEGLDHGLSDLQQNGHLVCSSADTDHFQPQIRTTLNLADLPDEILIKIVEECLLHPPHISKREWTCEARHVRRDHGVLLGGSLRHVTLVSHQFRALTAPYLFESICISDHSTSNKEDKLRSTHEQLVGLPTYEWLRYMKKFTISLGRTSVFHYSYAAQDFVEMLNYMQWPTTMRYVLEKDFVTYKVLNDVRRLLTKWRRVGMQFEVFKVRQLELSCVWSSHRWDFQFLTWPYLNTERIWLDFNTDHLKPQSLALDRLRNLEYVMHRAHPVGFFSTHAELYKFQGLTAPDGRRPPFLRQLGNTMQHVRHLALCGVLKGRVTEIAPLLCDMRSLEQLDITDQQAITEHDIYNIREIAHPIPEFDWAIKYSRLTREHPDNVDRIEAATIFFSTLPNLQRICFVRDQIGVVYQVVREGVTGRIERVEEIETIQERFRYLKLPGNSSAVWRCGFPNRLNYSLWTRAGGPESWCCADESFWLDPTWLTGDESSTPNHLRFDAAQHAHFGVRSPEEEELLQTRYQERMRWRRELNRRDDFIRAQWASRQRDKRGQPAATERESQASR